MPYDEPDPNDPNVLIGVSLPAHREATEEMARAFAEEFAAMGWDETRLLALFRRPFYAGAHQAYRVLGEETIRTIIQESVRVWGSLRVNVRDKEDLVQIGIAPGERSEPGRGAVSSGALGVGPQGRREMSRAAPERGASEQSIKD